MNIIAVLLWLIVNNKPLSLVAVPDTSTTISEVGYANIHQWDGGTLVYAHDYMSGSEFYDLVANEIVVAGYSDGTQIDYRVTGAGIYTYREVVDFAEWERILRSMSGDKILTLVTCYQPKGWYFVKLAEVQNGR